MIISDYFPVHSLSALNINEGTVIEETDALFLLCVVTISPWFNGSLVKCFLGPVLPWSSGSLAQWFLSSVAP